MTMLPAVAFLMASCALGYVLTRRLTVPWSVLEMSAASVVAGLACGTLLVYASMSATGSIGSAMMLALAVMAVIPVAQLQFLRSRKPSLQKLHPTDTYVFTGVLLLVSAFFLWCFLRPGPGGLMITPRSYGDNLLHVSIASSFAWADNVPPTYPNFSGAPMAYYFLMDLLSGILLHGGMSLTWAFILPQILIVGAFFFLFYALAHRITQNRNAAMLALVLLIFSTSLGFVRAAQDLAGGRPVDQVFLHTGYGLDFDRGLYKMGMLELVSSQRPLGLGLALAALIFLVLADSTTRSKYEYVYVGLLLGVLAHAHLLVFLFVVLAGIGCLVTVKGRGLPWVVAPSLIALPKLWSVHTEFPHATYPVWKLGWMVHPLTFSHFLAFWAINWGVLVLLFLLSLHLIRREHWYVAVAIIGAIALMNLVQLQPFDWDNHKLVDTAIVFSLPWTALLLVTWFQRSNLHKAGIVLLVLVLTVTGLQSLVVAFANSAVIFSWQDMQAAAWANRVLPKHARVLTVPDNTIVNTLAGRSVYVGYPGQLWSHGFDYAPRQLDIELLARFTSQREFCDRWMATDLTHLIIGPRERTLGFKDALFRSWGWQTDQFDSYALVEPTCP